MAQVKWARWGLGGAAVIAVGATFLLLFTPRPVDVDAGVAVIGPIAETVADRGATRVHEPFVVSAPVSGRVERITLHVGDRVIAQTTPIARIQPANADLLDPRTRAQAEAQVAASQSAVTAASAQHDQAAALARNAEIELKRRRALSEKGFATPQSLDAAEADARSTRAAEQAAGALLQVRRAELASARSALMGPDSGNGREVTVTAPISGYVTQVIQQSERTLARGAPLVELGDQGALEAAIEFLSQDAVRIREGMAAEIYDWGGDGVLAATVSRVEPQGFTKISALGVEEQRVLVLLRFTAPPADWSRLGPGYRVWGRVFLRKEARAVKAPLGALVRTQSRWGVYRIIDGRARLTPVEVGALSDREAEIRSGLKPDDRVVIFPTDQVRDGVRIRERAM